MSLCALGCAGRPPHVASAPPPPAPTVDHLRFRIVKETLAAEARERLRQQIEDVFVLQGEVAVVEPHGDDRMHVVLPVGARRIPWPQLLALVGVAAPAAQPLASDDFELPLQPDWLAAFEKRALAETLAQLQQRLMRLNVVRSHIHVDGDVVQVDVPDLAPSWRDRLRRALSLPLRLQVQMQRPNNVPAVDAGGHAVPTGDAVVLQSDLWPSAAGMHSEQFWRSDDPALLELFVAVLRRAVAPDSQLLVGFAARHGQRYYRSYLVERRAALTSDDIVGARIVSGKQPDDELVALQLSPAGAKRFERLTRDHVGAELVIVIDRKSVV